jgi:hypothetical protein
MAAQTGITGRRRARAADPGEELARLRELGEPVQAPAAGGQAGAGLSGSAVQGGMVGIGAGMLFGGPVGLGLGALTGILGAIDERRTAATAAAWQESIADKQEKAQHTLAAVMNDEGASQAERDSAAERYRLNIEFYNDVLQLGPELGPQALARVSETDRARQAEIDREAITLQRNATLEHRKALRGKAEGVFRGQNELEQRIGTVRTLLDDPEFDPDQPQNQAVLAQLLEQTQRNMLTNAEDMTDAMRGIGGTGLLGLLAAVASFTFGAEKAEQMRMTREQWRILFAANEQVTRQRHMQEREALYTEATEHVAQSERLGLAPDEFTALMSKFRGAEERAAEPVLPGRGGFPVGIEGPKRDPRRNTNGGLFQAQPDVDAADLRPVESARDFLELNRRRFEQLRERFRR